MKRRILVIEDDAAVRTTLLELAALIRCSTDPDPECIADLHQPQERRSRQPLDQMPRPPSPGHQPLGRARWSGHRPRGAG